MTEAALLDTMTGFTNSGIEPNGEISYSLVTLAAAARLLDSRGPLPRLEKGDSGVAIFSIWK